MKTKYLLTGSLTLALAGGLLATGALAAFEDRISVTNQIAMGDVRIDLAEYEIRDTQEQNFTNDQIVLPGDDVSKVPRIANLGEPCWVRALLTFSGDQVLTEDSLVGLGFDWQKIGDYFYYTKPLPAKQSTEIFKGLHIPETLTEENSGESIQLSIQAEAIQRVGFTPDFSSTAPWGTEMIEDCVHETTDVSATVTKPIKFRVEFEGGAHRLIAEPDDFFQNFSRLMPGTSHKDFVTISNTTDRAAELFFFTDYDSQSKEQMELLEQLSLTIMQGEKVLYQGNLKAEALKPGISLGIYEPGQKSKITYEITVPKSLTNTYAQRAASVRWIYSVKEQESPTPTESPSTPSGGSGGYSGGSGPSPVKTEDSSPLLPLTALGIGAMTLAAVTGRRKWRRNHEA